MNNKLLVFDLDGTLLTSQKTVLRSTAAAINECKARNMLIGYITARSPWKTGFFLQNLPCDCNAYYNGATIFVGGSLIESNLIPYDKAVKIIGEIQNTYPNSKIGAYLEPYSYFEGEIYHMETKEVQKICLIDLPHYDVQRIRISFNKHDIIHLERFMDKETIYYVTSDGTAIISNKSANKGHALIKLASHLNIPLTEVIAFGDDVNDGDMLKIAGIGIAMGNAIECLKENADFITETNDNGGIAVWIGKHVLKEL